ncbi:MAG TPA: S8 family serine peptidase [Gaiellaceae bacterium]
MQRLSGALVALVVLVLTIAVAGATAGGRTVSDLGTSGPTVDSSSAIVQLNGDPLSTYVKTKPAPGKKVDFSSNTTKSYRAQLSALRNDFKQWLKANAPAVKVTGEFDISLNAVAVQLNGASLGTIASAPMVKQAQYEGLYRPLDNNDPDLALIHAIDAWTAVGGPGNAGAGVKVGIIDTGIDQTHDCFNPAGYAYPAGFPKGDHSFTTPKVIVAKVFNNQSNRFGYTARAVQEHGTHVAGTVACNLDTNATVAGVSIPYGVSGVAPRAYLGNYNVFPGTDDNARSEDILNALDAAYEDGMDVINMSLGGNAHGVQDLLTNAVNDLDQAGMISAVAVGNSGPGHYTVESPGSAERALTAGAMTVGHFIAAPVTVGGNSHAGVSGDFAKVSTDLTAPLGVVLSGTALSTACAALPAGSLSGKIALISRGACTFSTKIRNAEGAGAIATLVVNSVAGDATAMGQDGTPNQPTKPAYMVALASKAALMAADGQSTTIGSALAYFTSPNSNIMAGFSSQGPTDVDFRVKPDVVSPGVNVLSSIPGNQWAFFQGTSMATPHLAGSAAVVIGAHPDWSAAAVRSAIVNTADQGVLLNSNGTTTAIDPNIIGAGRDNVLSALNARVGLDPVSLSFGAVPSGSGQTKSKTIAVTTLSGAAPTAVTISSSSGSGVSYAVALSGGTISVTMSAAQGASPGDHQATLRVLSAGTEIAHAVVYMLVK